MGNWLFLMLLYAFFGWMKKKQKDKFIKKMKKMAVKNQVALQILAKAFLNALIGDEKVPIQNQENIENVFELEDDDLASDIK